ncbi:hypothetical protein tinsulaeT_10570 [Thalassotalea insulae]|uniref:site-specific DNA-methyltransferase (adenine-specific) n=1 Tax=Thalassotalea insulae TaxID=2056778 RepID=A0ABQ6GST5_9GAMM|nr:N-6 DNA methylase [Thalassotalea insulae]GLX77717.1 hypothetical protein tinsulaeT_10570 [Thalassotalea insulae]
MKELTYKEFFSIFINGVNSFYKHLSTTDGDELKDLGEYRAAVALTFDVITNSLKSKSLTSINENNWRETFKSFAIQIDLISHQSDVDIHSGKILGLVQQYFESVSETLSKTNFPLEYLGQSFEQVYGALPIKGEGGNLEIGTTQDRRSSGVYFTPKSMVELLSDYSLSPLLNNKTSVEEILDIKIIDPAVGPGLFLVESSKLIAQKIYEIDKTRPLEEIIKEVIKNCVHGVDIDPLIVEVAKSILLLEADNCKDVAKALERNVKVGDSLLGLTLNKLKYGGYKAKLNGHETALSKSSELKSLNKYNKIHNEYFSEHINGVLEKTATKNSAIYTPFSWDYEFPDVFSREHSGFDVVISNPPWGKIKPNSKEFYSHILPCSKNYQGKDLKEYVSKSGINKELWEEYIKKTKIYSRVLSKSGIYSAQSFTKNGITTRGDADLYKYFMERVFEISTSTARIGLIIPSSFLFSEGAAGLRELYLKNGTFEKIYDFLNKKRLFQIHPMFQFLILSYKKEHRAGIQDLRFNLTELPDISSKVALDNGQNICLPYEQIQKISKSILNIPKLANKYEKDLLLKLSTGFPLLGETVSNAWNVKFVREVDMTNGSNHFVRQGELNQDEIAHNSKSGLLSHDKKSYFPVIEGKMVHQYDYAAKGYMSGQARTAVWKPLTFTNKKVLPHYYMSKDDCVQKRPECTSPRAGFCDVTGPLNERTVLAALIPGNTICGNKVPTCRFDNEDPSLHLIWTAMANSFVIDWLIRRRITTTLNFFHWNLIPFPRVQPNSEIGKILISDCAQLSAIQSENLELNNWLSSYTRKELKEDSKEFIRARIDACVASIFNLELSEFELILEDFKILDRKQPKMNGDKSNITKHMALYTYECLRNGTPVTELTYNNLFSKQKGSESNIFQEIVNSKKQGSFGYVPTELAKEMLESGDTDLPIII